jgi:hypothetical protein
MNCQGTRGLLASAVIHLGTGNVAAAKPMLEALSDEFKEIDNYIAELEAENKILNAVVVFHARHFARFKLEPVAEPKDDQVPAIIEDWKREAAFDLKHCPGRVTL